MPTIKEVLWNASRAKEGFKESIGDMSYQAKGILFSEMLFLVAAVGTARPRRIIESGRARGLSTSILARYFHDSEIISVDLEDCPSDVMHVNAIKSSWPNVTTIRGDSREVLPEIVQAGDIVLIDGPKSFRAIVLSFELLAARRPSLVFIHDLYQGQQERELLHRYVPEAIFSDNPSFVQHHRDLDDSCWEIINKEKLGHWKPFQYAGAPQKSYGPTLSCIPPRAGRDYGKLSRIMLQEGFLERANYLKRIRQETEE
ncbi:MAG: hypothetical protein O7C75_15405 [Verrucomicrobia bacterium]|nr:hypothetical protein [Verrucomicrobiota bacterium]